MTASIDLNVVSFLRRAAERVPDRPCLIFDGGEHGSARTSFSELWRRVDRIATGFVTAGLEPGDRAIVMIPMSVDLYGVLLGLLKMGAVAVFVDPWIDRRQIAAFAAFADPRAYVGTSKSHLLRWMDRRLRRIPVSVTTGRRLWRWPAGRTLAELSSMPGDGQIHPVSANDPALITFTSGSSGMPKGANRTHGFLAAQHRALSLEFPYHDGDVDMPMFPVFALNNIAQGISSVVPQVDFRRVDTMDTARILRQIYRHGVTTCTASPVFFDRLATHVEETPRMRPHLRRILTGGAPVSNSQLRAWQRAFQETEIHVVYGSTEAEPVASISAAECLSAADESRSRAPGYCVGRPTEQVRTRIIRIQRGPVTLEAGGWPSWEIPPHEIGELLVTGEHVCRDYYRSQSAVRENKIIEPPGTIWHRMGDTGYFDRAGRFWLVGRVHSTIFRAGQAIHPQLVEQAAVADDPRIRRAATVGFPDEHLGERVVLALETEANGELRAEVEARLREAGQITDEIVLLNDKLPVDPRHNAKIDYNRLRKQLRGRLSRGSGR